MWLFLGGMHKYKLIESKNDLRNNSTMKRLSIISSVKEDTFIKDDCLMIIVLCMIKLKVIHWNIFLVVK